MTSPSTLLLDHFIPYRMSVASNMVSDVIASAYRSLFGLSVPEWRLVAVLAEKHTLTQFELCTATQMDKVMVSRAAGALVDRGLVERSPNPDDRRSHLLSLTADGRALYGDVAPKALALEKELLSNFRKDEVEKLVEMLLRLQDAAARMGA